LGKVCIKIGSLGSGVLKKNISMEIAYQEKSKFQSKFNINYKLIVLLLEITEVKKNIIIYLLM